MVELWSLDSGRKHIGTHTTSLSHNTNRQSQRSQIYQRPSILYRSAICRSNVTIHIESAPFSWCPKYEENIHCPWPRTRRYVDNNARLTLSENGYGARTRDEGGPCQRRHGLRRSFKFLFLALWSSLFLFQGHSSTVPRHLYLSLFCCCYGQLGCFIWLRACHLWAERGWSYLEGSSSLHQRMCGGPVV